MCCLGAQKDISCLGDLVLVNVVAEKMSCLYVPVFTCSKSLFSAYLRHGHVLLHIFRLHKHLG